MTTFRVQLALRSPLGTPLTADTFFGHICWGIAYDAGAAELRDFLAEMATPDPPLVFSDPLLADHWPMPVLPIPGPDAYQRLFEFTRARAPAGPRAAVHAHDRIRAALRRAWIPHALWPRIAAECDAASIAAALIATPADPEHLVSATMAHNTINRLRGRPLDEGGLFIEELHYPTERARYDVWVRTRYDLDRVRRLFENGLAAGYGRGAGTGAGRLELVALESAELPAPDAANGLVTLGTCAPAEQDPTAGFWKVDVRFGKLGGAWSAGAASDAVFKYPLVLLARGATFRAAPVPPLIGRLVPEMHPGRREVVTCGWTLTLPVRLSPEVAA